MKFVCNLMHAESLDIMEMLHNDNKTFILILVCNFIFLIIFSLLSNDRYINRDT